jgi:RND family efflux transporter MFP subunit
MHKFLAWALLPGFFLLAAGCGSQVEGKATEDADATSRAKAAVEEVLIPIQAEAPGRRDISSYFETTTRIQAENRVDVISKGTGLCEDVRVEVGDRVKEGDVLARLDKEELEAQLRQSRVTVQQNKYQMEKAQEQLEKGILSSFEAQNARFAYDQAVATLELQQVQMKNQTITAPITGTVTMRGVQQGMLVSSGTPAFSIVDPDSYFLPISPPEKELTNLSVGQKAEVRIDSNPGDVLTASVRRIDPAVDPTSGTIRVILDFEDQDRELLREASFARVKLVMNTHADALVVPKDTLIEENARNYLMVVEAQEKDTVTDDMEPTLVASRVEVETGLEDSDFVEITSGVEEDDLIVTLGQHTLKTGSAVRITNASDEILSKAKLTAEEALKRASEQEFEIDTGEDRREKMLR